MINIKQFLKVGKNTGQATTLNTAENNIKIYLKNSFSDCVERTLNFKFILLCTYVGKQLGDFEIAFKQNSSFFLS